MKTVAILQSNYIPWKGYFDLIGAVDEFIFLDDVQFTKNDWRNRNRIKTQGGVKWLSIPVGSDLDREIREVELPAGNWRRAHWNALVSSYGRARYFDWLSPELETLYSGRTCSHLSTFNRAAIEMICRRLAIGTRFSWSWEYKAAGRQTDRLIALCHQSGAKRYITGPAAKSYLDQEAMERHGIVVEWFDYAGYPAYPQLWGDFVHEVSVLDLLFNCGPEARNFMKLKKS